MRIALVKYFKGLSSYKHPQSFRGIMLSAFLVSCTYFRVVLKKLFLKFIHAVKM